MLAIAPVKTQSTLSECMREREREREGGREGGRERDLDQESAMSSIQ